MTSENPGDADRTRDSVEQLEGAELPNPITQDAGLTEPGEGFEPGTDDTPDDPAQQGPVPRTTQMPR